jgi:hypothetical protein
MFRQSATVRGVSRNKAQTRNFTSMKYLAYLMTALMLVASAEAKKKKNNDSGQAKKAQQEKEKARKEREAKSKAIKEFLDDKDKNHDGSVTLDEYLAGETDTAAATKKFEEFNKNHDRYLSKSEIADMLGL